MSLHAAMTDRVRRYTRTAESDAYTLADTYLRAAKVHELSRSGDRREQATLEFGATHLVYLQRDTAIVGGDVLVRESDGANFRVKAALVRSRPGPGVTRCECVRISPAVT